MLVGFAGSVEAEEKLGGDEDAAGGFGDGADLAVDLYPHGALVNLGGTAGAAIEGAVAEVGFNGDVRVPAEDGVGVVEDVFAGEQLGGEVASVGDETRESLGLLGMASVIDASDFHGASAIGGGEAIDDEVALSIAPGFTVHDEFSNGETGGCAGFHSSAWLSMESPCQNFWQGLGGVLLAGWIVLFAEAAVLAGLVAITGGDKAEACDDFRLGDHQKLGVDVASAVGDGGGMIGEDIEGMNDHGSTGQRGLVIDQGGAEVTSGEGDEGFHLRAWGCLTTWRT